MKKFLSFALTAILFFCLGAIVCGLPGDNQPTAPSTPFDTKDPTRGPDYRDSHAAEQDVDNSMSISTGSNPNLNANPNTGSDSANPSSQEYQQETVLPIYVDYDGTWYDQDMNAIDLADATAFFGRNRAYARVLVALNRVCFAKGFPSRDTALDAAYATALTMPHDVEEYLGYEWILKEMPADYDWCLNEFYDCIAEIDDIDFRLTANSLSSCIILGKLIEFQHAGAYPTLTNTANNITADTNSQYIDSFVEYMLVGIPKPQQQFRSQSGATPSAKEPIA